MSTPYRIELSVPRHRAEIRAGLEDINAQVAKLLAGLELPIDATIAEISEPPDGEDQDSDNAIVTMAGQRLCIAIPETVTVPAFRRTVLGAILRARELFVTPELGRVLADRWSLRLDDGGYTHLTWLFARLVRYGLRPSRVRDALVELGAKPLDEAVASLLLENALSGDDCGRVKIRWGTAREAEYRLSTEYEQGLQSSVRDHVYEECGVSARIEPIVTDDKLASEVVEVRWHDVATEIDGASLAEVVDEIKRLLVRSAGSFVSRELIELYLLRLRPVLPRLVEALEKCFTVARVAATLRALVDEGLSIRDIATVLRCLLAVDGTSTANYSERIVFVPSPHVVVSATTSRSVPQLSIEELAESVRIQLKRYLTSKHMQSGTLVVYLLSPQVEKWISNGQERDKVIGLIGREVGSKPSVILTTTETRRPLSQLVRYAYPEVAALSYNELSPDVSIQPLARISENPWPNWRRYLPTQ